MISNVTKVLREAFEKTRLDAFEKGKKQGSLAWKLEIAKRMLKEDLPMDMVVRVTGLSHGEIKTGIRETQSGHKHCQQRHD